MSSQLTPIETLNTFDRKRFDESVHLLFEPAPPLSEKLYALIPFHSYKQLLDAAIDALQEMNESEKIVVLDAHPKIGAAKETLSALSYQEQGYTNPNQQSNQQFLIQEKLIQMNNEYEKKYGFKFVVFVNGRSRAEIIPVFEQRLHHSSRSVELETGLRDMMEIARDRLNKLSS